MNFEKSRGLGAPDPLKPAFSRLDDARIHWQQAEDNYFDPQGFRVAVNACIQTLRNVTFALQKNKKNIPNFQHWYSEWQSRLKADPVTAWSVEARNRIVKKGDLELGSISQISVVASYYDTPILSYTNSPNQNTRQIFDKLNLDKIPPEIAKNGFLKLERRWAVKDLPASDLLDALAHCYGQLSLLLHDGWRLFDPDFPRPNLKSGQLSCMVRSNEDRALWIRLSTGEVAEWEQHNVDEDSHSRDEIIARYGNDVLEMDGDTSADLLSLAKTNFVRARRLLEVDGNHALIAILISPTSAGIMQLKPDDQADKYRMWRHVADAVARHDATIVIVIGEAWEAVFEDGQNVGHAADSPNRIEALTLDAISKEGEQISIHASFTRKSGRIIIDESKIRGKPISLNYLEPIRKVWEQ